ncbi:MAG: EAL domain-containing protein [Hydrogenimonas sp.]|nr:EAL domain-containing protein [Hydrogenimonas sp.]
MSKEKLVTIRRRMINTIALFLIISIALVILVGVYLKRQALTELAVEDARHSSQLIFENLYTKMQEGWSKEDIRKILRRLNEIRPGMKIDTYRSDMVEELYGRIPEDYKKVESDPLIQEALRGKEIIRIDKENAIRYLYPIHVETRCIECHPNAKEGDINGVIDIKMPAQQIILSLDQMIIYFVLALAILLILFFAFFYWVFDKRLVVPLTDLSFEISKIKEDSDLDRKIHVESDCKELKLLERSFNTLMSRIKFYYEKLLASFFIDPLTKLGNIYRLKKDLEEKKPASMLLLNIDRFKELNDYYGFELGDKVLKEIAENLKKIIPPETKLYRIGGSEFAIVGYTQCDPKKIEQIMEEIHRISFGSKELEGLRITVTGGVVENQTERLIEKASVALNAAKKRKKLYEYYRNSTGLEADYKRHIRWMKEIEDAIEDNRIVPYFQPIVKVGNKKIKRYEVLVRLIDKNGNTHVPDEFLEVAQNSRLYASLTRIIIEEAFAYFKNCRCSFSINLSINDIKDALCRDHIYRSLRNYPSPERVTFEILESEEISDFQLINEFIGNIHRFGAKIAIDDFGSGYSNFHYLLKMKVDYYKIDASLIRYLVTDEDSKMLVESIVRFAKKLGIETIAEYVENEEIAKMCEELGIDYLQGYYIGKPIPVIQECHK